MLHLTRLVNTRPIHIFLIVTTIAALAHPSFTQKSSTTDSGVFVILSSQQRVGSEKFKITSTVTGTEAAGEIEVNMPGSPKASETCMLKLGPGLYPVSYERQQKSPKKGSIAAQFGSPESKLVSSTEAGTENRIFFLPADHLTVLDTNFFHHYTLLLRQYDAERGGPQQFNVFVPQEATPGTIKLEFQGKENQQVGKTVREFNHYQAATDDVRIDIWATPQAEIYRMAIPQANLEVVRQ
ncbi:MAG: hypothetical protein HYX72_01740 [Acidobacteria bacterium]|nr:hypothetical protein [Acidobacteriota bacterium]